MANMQFEEERKGKERKENQFWIQLHRTTIHATQKGRECRDKSNDTAKSRLQPLNRVTCAIEDGEAADTWSATFLFFFFVKNQKYLISALVALIYDSRALK
jgi:hypothetical protein